MVGYGIAYTRYGDTKLIDELRHSHKQLQHEYHHLENQLQEYLQQNKILKHNAQSLLDQNEDFAKMVSELSRYYYHIKQGAAKVQELQNILGIYDDEMETKLSHLDTDLSAYEIPEKPAGKQFF
ncbi:MAG: hypothetical protein H6765_06920 [Candidatus Peribacteria bacterium]|nr:MAG: hypothetical protein H6765_06920 [Candidatus Peribacteria bacterium]